MSRAGGARDASTLSGMLATTLVGIVFVPGLFVLFRKPSEMKTDK